MSVLKNIAALIGFVTVDAPVDLVPGPLEITFSTPGVEPIVTQAAAGSTTFTFVPTQPGDWTGSVRRLATTGEQLSASVSATINVPVPVEPPAQMDVPTSITLTLA